MEAKNGVRNHKDVSLVFMAAGMGRRFGGNKQLAGLGPRRQSLMAYTAYDAYKIGYKRLIFILREDMVEEFMKTLGERLSQFIDVKIVIQDLNKLPEGVSISSVRDKPLGTGHALYCAKDELEGPFVILNADDLYGRNVLKDLYDALVLGETMVIPGYPVKNTLSDKGKVSRGVLQVDENEFLVSIRESEKIWADEDGSIYYEENDTRSQLSEDTLVSMNIWGMQKEALSNLDEVFLKFLSNCRTDLLKDEFYLPEAMDSLRKRNGIDLKIIEAKDSWVGMTYEEDAKEVSRRLKTLVENGVYPESLFGE